MNWDSVGGKKEDTEKKGSRKAHAATQRTLSI